MREEVLCVLEKQEYALVVGCFHLHTSDTPSASAHESKSVENCLEGGRSVQVQGQNGVEITH